MHLSHLLRLQLLPILFLMQGLCSAELVSSNNEANLARARCINGFLALNPAATEKSELLFRKSHQFFTHVYCERDIGQSVLSHRRDIRLNRSGNVEFAGEEDDFIPLYPSFSPSERNHRIYIEFLKRSEAYDFTLSAFYKKTMDVKRDNCGELVYSGSVDPSASRLSFFLDIPAAVFYPGDEEESKANDVCINFWPSSRNGQKFQLIDNDSLSKQSEEVIIDFQKLCTSKAFTITISEENMTIQLGLFTTPSS